MEKDLVDRDGTVADRSLFDGVTYRFPPLTQCLLSKLLCLNRFTRLHAQMAAGDPGKNVFDRMLEVLGVRFEIAPTDFARLPRTGPAMVVANHPFGGIEGLILGSILDAARPEFKIMANYLLHHLSIPEFSGRFLYVDPFAGKESVRANIKPVREAIEWVKGGGMLGLFPAGEVSHFHLRRREITDPMWSESVARIVRNAAAPVLPIFFAGSNSLIFQVLGLLHPRLRTVMLPREMLNKGRHIVQVKVGKLIPAEKLLGLRDDRSMMEYLRVKTYLLGNRIVTGEKRRGITIGKRAKARDSIVAPQPADLLAAEVDALPADQLLVDTGKFAVFVADSRQVPHLLQEIGRLREITFRQAGEGTGRAIDLDRFDRHYLHLFLWSREAGEVAGGYRLGLTDRILAQYGREGLYTSTLFDYQAEFLDHIGSAVELGRSFVRPEYQKSYQPLMLLWKGIGRFISDRPHYRMLFGPVSVSNDYHSVSRQLIVAFSRKNCHRRDLARFVKGNEARIAQRKFNSSVHAASALLQDVQDLSELISDIERDQKGVPILLKHYLKLGGESLGFSMDHDFSGVMDVLILVDLARTNPGMLARYMGKDGAESFLAYHHGRPLAECA